MERILDLYAQAYNSLQPVICFDERPCQLIGNVLLPMAMKPGRIQREDYEYQRNGTCSILMAFEPLSGKRIIEVRDRRTKRDYAEFMRALATRYSTAEKIIVIQDNLNTHSPSSFYERFPAEEAFALAQQIEMVYTPKKASWLNMVEFELSALSRQCLARRIDTIEKLRHEVLIWADQRDTLGVTAHWLFSKNKAREKFSRHYYH